MCLFHIKSRVSILLHILSSHLLWPKADMYRMLHVGNSLGSDKLTPSLIPQIDTVITIPNMIVTLSCSEGINILELINVVTFHISIFNVCMSTSIHQGKSRAHELCILRQNQYLANCGNVTIQQHNHPNAVVVQRLDVWRNGTDEAIN